MFGRSTWRVGKFGSKKLQLVDDFSDKLNYQFSIILIIVLISAICVKQYFGKPIQCWTPQEFSNNWEKYAESYCGMSYSYTINQGLPGITMTKIKNLSNNQWASILLVVQAFLFCIPCMIWRLMILQSGFNLQRIMQTANNANAISSDHLQKSIKFIAIHMDKCLNTKNINITEVKSNSCAKGGCCNRSSGRYLSYAYIIIKLLYFLNIVGQFYLIQKFIGTNYSLHGIEGIYDLLIGNDLRSSDNFPKNTYCDLETKKLGKNHRYTLQCVLPLNMFLEKIFILLWFWNLIIGCITAISLLNWLNKLLNKKDKSRFIGEYLKLTESVKKSEELWEKQFVLDYLQTDGIFVMHLISLNVGDIVAADVVCELWNFYRTKNQNQSETSKLYDETKLSEFNFPNVKKEISEEFPGKSFTDNII